MPLNETGTEVPKTSETNKLDFDPDKLKGSDIKGVEDEPTTADSLKPVDPDKLIRPPVSNETAREVKQADSAREYKHIPLESSSLGEWAGERGDSLFLPNNPEAKAELNECGVEGIEFKEGNPDFSLIAKAQVQIEGFTDQRLSKVVDGKRIVGNFEKAETALADQWNAEGRDGRSDWTRQEVKAWKAENGLTWHECRDMKTMQLVPTATHDI